MKKLITLLTLCGASLSSHSAMAQAPQHEWTSTYHITTANETYHDIYCTTSDRYGNVYVSGYTADTITFNNGGFTHNVGVQGNDEVFIGKYNSNGDLLWFKTFQSDPYIYIAATDSMGNLFLAGRFSGTIDIDPGAGTVNVTSTNSTNSGVIAKFDSAGNYVAHTLIPGQSWIEPTALTVDHQGNVVTAGVFQGGCYLAKYNNALTTNSWGDSYQGSTTIHSISCDPNGDIYVAGQVNGNGYITFGSVGIVQNNISWSALFKGKLDASGVEQWGELVATGNASLIKPQVVATGNGVFFSGLITHPNVTETINFDNVNGSTAGEITFDVATNYIVEYNEDGEFQHLMSLPGYDAPNYLQKDAFGNVYSSAMFFGQDIDVDPGSSTYEISSTNTNAVVYLIKLDSAFGFIGAGAFDNYTGKHRMTVSPMGAIYHLGTFGGITDLDLSTGVANTTPITMMDGFVVKSSLCNISGGFSTQVNVSNGTGTAAQAGAIYQWLDCDNGNAPIAGATNQAYTPTVAGNYAVVITLSGCYDTSACENIIPVSVENVGSASNAVVYPNPANDYLVVAQATAGSMVSLTDMAGRVLYNATIETKLHTINTSGYANGMYLLNIEEEGVRNTQKIIINK